MNTKIKKLLILNTPYLFLALLFTKVSQAWRYAAGYEIADKILNLMDGFSAAFKNPLPSLYPQDLWICVCQSKSLAFGLEKLCTCQHNFVH